MKPLKVTMQAFGSYGKQTEIDFTRTEQNLFLITGDTGAGKSTVFDAIVFALYGETSSTDNAKSGNLLQSQFANFELEPYVELTFTEGEGDMEETYVIRRVPKHERLKKRGANGENPLTGVSGSVSLLLPEGRAFVGKEKETNQKIEEIVGLTKQQFMQVAMIAQGEFVKLLRADSKVKKEIFRKLFHTEFYDAIVEELNKRNHEWTVKLGKVRTELQTLVSRIEIPEDYERYEEMHTLIQMISQDQMGRFQEFMEELDCLEKEMLERAQKGKDEAEASQKKRDACRDALTEANSIKELFAQQEKATRELMALKDKEMDRKAKSELLDTLTHAFEVQSVYRSFDESQQEVAVLQENLAQEQLQKPILVEALAKAKMEEERRRKILDEAMQEFTATEERVKRAREHFQKEAELQQQWENQAEQVKVFDEEVQQIEQKMQSLKSDIEEMEEKKENLADRKVQQEQWLAKKEGAERLQLEAQEVKRGKAALRTLQEAEEEAKEAYRKASTAYEEAQKQMEGARKHFLDSQAGILAAELIEGEPCPVCGSREHPRVFVPEHLEENVVSKEALQEMQASVEALREKQSRAAETASGARGKREASESQWNKAKDKLEEDAKKVLQPWGEGDLMESIATYGTEVASLLKELQQDLEMLEELQTQLLEKRELWDDFESRYKEKQVQWQEAKKQLEALAAQKAMLEESKDFPSLAEAEVCLQKASDVKQGEEVGYQRAHEIWSQAKDRLQDCETKIATYVENLPQKEAQTKERERAYRELLDKKEYKLTDWQDLVTTYTREDLETMRTALAEEQKALAAAQSAVDTTTEALKGKEKPDLEKLQEELQQAQEIWNQCAEESKQVEQRMQIILEVQKDLQKRMEHRAEMLKESGRVSRMYQMAAGKVSGSRMDLETYAQRYYLQRILQTANRRFYSMSGGQFELRMVDLERAGDGKNRGLDLMIYSFVTGKEREIRTLSGGESFMAALALALGMADQIQASSSAIHLDMMFIDEGFGSLDEHARGQAVRVLKEMAEGQKFIGIISHVTELKQEIEDQLVVTKDEEGSHAVWSCS